MFVTNPEQPTGCNETTQLTIVFSCGHRAGINSLNDVEMTVHSLAKDGNFIKGTIPPSGEFFVYDFKRKEVMQKACAYAYNPVDDYITIIEIPGEGEE